MRNCPRVAGLACTITAPAGATSPVTAALRAQAAYGSAGRRERVIAMEQSGPNPGPLPPPATTGSSPPSPTPGDAVTLTGQNFGATPPDSGSFPLTPGTAMVTVTVGGQGSNTETNTITS